MKKNLFAGVSRPPRFLNDLHFSACFKNYYYEAVVEYSSYFVLS